MTDLTGVTWRKSSRSNNQGACLEVAGLDRPLWQKSSRSNSQGQCVEVATDARVVAVRDSKDPTGPALPFAVGSWEAFVAGVRAGALQH